MMATRRRASPRRSSAVKALSRHLQPFLATRLAILLLPGLISTVASTPISYFPLNSQLPPVARVSEPFSFVFSPLTFASDAKMTYALVDGFPPWLSLDSASRRLSGTPDEASVPLGDTLVGVVIGLVASDDTGSTTTNATLVVSRAHGPVVRIPFEDQAENFGPHSTPASVLLHPSSEFRFEFDPNTFGAGVTGAEDSQSVNQDMKRDENAGGGGPQFNYYAVSGDNAPLPSWVSFDPGKLAFSGKTPAFESLVQPPQKFDFQLVASDVVGFSSVSIAFSIMVGPHELTVEESMIRLNATRDKQLEYTDLPDILKLDQQPLNRENVSSITASSLPAWLSFDEESWKLSGTPDAETQPTNVTIVVIDKFLDTLNVTLEINFHTRIFASNLPKLNVSAGDDLSFDLKKYLLAPTDTQITAEIGPDDTWVRFDDSSKVLSGKAPKVLAAGHTGDIRIIFKATQTRTEDKEAKDLNIHVNELPPVNSPKPDMDTDTKGSDSNKNLYWLLILPGLFIAVAIVLWVFRARRRQHEPRKLDFSEVSGPVPGTFVASGLMDDSSDSIGDMPDIAYKAPPLRPSGHPPSAPFGFRTSQTMPNPSTDTGRITPHAMTMFSGVAKPTHQGTETRGSWFVGRQSRVSPAVTDEVSLLSDTSLGEDVHIVEEDLSPKKLGGNMHVKKTGLEVPAAAEPFSIQPTPELAYKTARRYDYVSDDETPPPVSDVERQRSGHQQNADPGLRGVQRGLSKAWKRGSGSNSSGDLKRHSQLTASSDATTRTSILTSGITEEATTASTNVVAKPTVIHIPSRPGEARQVSRRTDDSSTFFGGRSLTKSQRNFGLEKDTMPASAYHPRGDPGLPTTSKEQDVTQGGGSSWARLDRNSLGIAYKDLIRTNNATGGLRGGLEEPGIGVAQSENWDVYHANDNLISPSRWPKPGVFTGLSGTVDAFQNQSEPPQLPPFKLPAKIVSPVTPIDKGKRRASYVRRSRGSGPMVSPLRTPSTHRRSKSRNSREERLRISRIREQKALDEFRAMMASQTPSPYNEWAPQSARELPETPSRISRVPLTDRLNESRGLKSTLSKRSIKTMRSNKSMRSGWAGDDDEDAWEDIRPPESIAGGWEPERSDGSFPVYI
ncbi:putative bud10 protein [Rosellinia necatrix]|uniref:Putative bud10 protein n=1 Tax=Rosellinia necatrix TaxID=77044 RepID=A0A1S7UIK7_ROSNE|nr:putative bud10 protein [Rosellinia necatrix]